MLFNNYLLNFSFVIFFFFFLSCSEKPSDYLTENDRDINLILECELQGNRGPTYSLDWSPDGKKLASAGFCEINIWDMDSLVLAEKISGYDSYVWCVSWLPKINLSILSSGCEDGTLKMWDTNSQKLLNSFNTGWTFCVTWSPEGNKYAFGNSEGKIEVREFNTDSLLYTYQLDKEGNFPANAIICMSWSPDKDLIAVGCWFGGTLIIDLSAREMVRVFDPKSPHRYDVNGLEWSQDGLTLATAHQDGYVRLWDIATHDLLQEIEAHTGWVRGISWSPDGNMFATGGEDKLVLIWDKHSGKKIKALNDSSQPIWSVGWSPDGRRLAAGGGLYMGRYSAGTLFVWKIED